MLKFNTGKTDLCVIGSHQQLSKLNVPLAIHVEQSEMVTDESITNLGVIMDQHLKLDWHVNKVFKVCMFHLRTISKIRRFLTIEACKLLIHALVTSRLDYCNSILYGCNQSVLQRLQLLQNYAARLVYKIPKFCHITPYLKDLHWLPVQARIQFKLLTIVFKCIHGNATLPQNDAPWPKIRKLHHTLHSQNTIKGGTKHGRPFVLNLWAQTVEPASSFYSKQLQP